MGDTCRGCNISIESGGSSERSSSGSSSSDRSSSGSSSSSSLGHACRAPLPACSISRQFAPPHPHRCRAVKKVQPVLGGFDSSRYATERLWATAPDGTRVPISLVYRTDLAKLDGTDPLLLDAYGRQASAAPAPVLPSI